MGKKYRRKPHVSEREKPQPKKEPRVKLSNKQWAWLSAGVVALIAAVVVLVVMLSAIAPNELVADMSNTSKPHYARVGWVEGTVPGYTRDVNYSSGIVSNREPDPNIHYFNYLADDADATVQGYYIAGMKTNDVKTTVEGTVLSYFPEATPLASAQFAGLDCYYYSTPISNDAKTKHQRIACLYVNGRAEGAVFVQLKSAEFATLDELPDGQKMIDDMAEQVLATIKLR